MSDRPNFDGKVHELPLTDQLYTEESRRRIAVYDELGAPRWDGRSDYVEYVKRFAAWEQENKTALRKAGIRGVPS
jgi:hypothetical protein